MTTLTKIEAPQFPAHLTLKSVKVNKAMSEETLAYTATIYVNGKRAGTAMNHGHGGPDMYRWEDPDLGVIADRIGREYDSSPYGGLEVLIGDMLAEREIQGIAKRMLKKGYRFALLCDDSTLYGYNDPAKLEQGIASYAREKYRVFEA